MEKIVRSLLLLLCALHLSSPNIVPNKFIHTENSEKTDLVTGVYYSLYNLGRNESERGGIVTFYVNQDARREDNDYELMYKTLILDKGNHVRPGGSHYDSTLFAFRQYKKNVYQIYSKKLKGVVSYKQTKTGEYGLVVYGTRMDVNEDIAHNGSHFPNTLFAIRRLKNGNYQLVCKDLNAVVDYSNVNMYPRELELRKPESYQMEQFLRKASVVDVGPSFIFDLAPSTFKILNRDTTIHTRSGPLNPESLDSDFVSIVLFKGYNTGRKDATYKVSYERKIKNVYKIVETTGYKSQIFLNANINVNVNFSLEVFQSVTEADLGLKIGLAFNTESTVSKGTENTTEKELVVSVDTTVTIPTDDEVTVNLTVHKLKGNVNYKSICDINVLGDRLNEDGSTTYYTKYDTDAVMQTCAMVGHKNKCKTNERQVTYLTSGVVDVDISTHFNISTSVDRVAYTKRRLKHIA